MECAVGLSTTLQLRAAVMKMLLLELVLLEHFRLKSVVSDASPTSTSSPRKLIKTTTTT